MILELENYIVESLKNAGIPAFAWSGKPEELFERPKYVPVARIVIEKIDYQSITTSNRAYDTKAQISVLLFFRNLQDQGQGAYAIIERIISALSGNNLNGFFILPSGISLLYHQSGEFAYQLTFTASGRYVVPDIDEVLTTQITMEEIS